MKRLLVLPLVCICTNALAQKTWTLKQCIDTAIANNITIQQSSFQVERDAASLKQSKANRLPDVNGVFNFGGSRGRSIDPFTNSFVDQAFNNSYTQLNATLPIYSGGQIQQTIAQNKELLNASKMDLQQAKDNITLNVIAAYLAILNNEDQLVVSKNQEEVAAKQVERLQIVAGEGAVAPYTLTDLKGERASNKVAVVNAGNALEQSKITLTRLMNIPYNTPIELSRQEVDLTMANYDKSSPEVYSEALTNMAQVKAADFRTLAAERSIKVARGGLFPYVSLGGGLGTSYSSAATKYTVLNEFFAASENYVISNGSQLPVYTKQQNKSQDEFGFGTQYNNNLNAQFGLNVQIPILSRLSVRNKITQAKINRNEAQALTNNTKVQLQQDVEQAHQNMVAAFNRYKILNEQVEALKESFRAAEVRFNNGVINSAEYIVIKNGYDRSVVNFTQAGYEYVLRTRILDYYRGKL
ncbi:MAG TPA: TolC family protein [Phnomibacter sp.]|nr:TolC family protein [Phnomibacter sp.]